MRGNLIGYSSERINTKIQMEKTGDICKGWYIIQHNLESWKAGRAEKQ